jgi:hypothetical protein
MHGKSFGLWNYEDNMKKEAHSRWIFGIPLGIGRLFLSGR